MLLGHGVGSRGDLPLPLWMFRWAAAIALIASFVALGALWTHPRLAKAAAGRPLVGSSDAQPLPVLRGLRFVGQALALVLFVIALWAGLFGENSAADNLLPVTLYVIVWVGALLIGGLIGDLWRAISPITTLARGVEWLATRAGSTPAEAPAGLGHWPAASGMAVFLFYELAHPSGSDPRTLAWMLVVHTIVSLTLAWRWGAGWIADNEPLAVLLSILSRMGFLFATEGEIRARPPMSGLATMPVLRGTAATLLVVLGGTTYDGFSESEAGRDLLGRPTGWGGAALESVGLLVSITVITLFFALGVIWTSKVTGFSLIKAADAFTPSLVPIVFGYAIAHYAQLLVDETQTFVFALSDPGGLGWDLFGGANGEINFNLISVDLIAWIQVLAILFGHIGAVVVAHDRSVELFKPGESLRSQFTMLLVMVAYSTLGLWLLLNA
ncbi:MAG: hypothetical protein GY773_03110 [Actinomycetia bacterium]|nr:hypothetical protein [Actinomycetes bacterium]